MGRHLSRILLNKVLIRAHVAPFQTKLGPHTAVQESPLPSHTLTHTHTADRGDPTRRRCFPPVQLT